MEEYDDIIGLPHHRSQKHPHMPIGDRAAQFAPFAALTGYGEAVEETRRQTCARPEKDEAALAELDFALSEIVQRIGDMPEVTLTCFIPDEKKDGGSFATFSGAVTKVDFYARRLIFSDGRAVDIADIMALSLD